MEFENEPDNIYDKDTQDLISYVKRFDYVTDCRGEMTKISVRQFGEKYQTTFSDTIAAHEWKQTDSYIGDFNRENIRELKSLINYPHTTHMGKLKYADENTFSY